MEQIKVVFNLSLLVIYSKYYSVFEPHYSKVLELICCGHSIVAVII